LVLGLLVSATPALAAAGTISEFPVPTAAGEPIEITTGPDGALWFTEETGNKIGRITTAGSFSEFSVPTAASFPIGITAGPDEALWFTESGGNKIGRITTAGSFSEFSVPTAASEPIGITAGPDGALWFTEVFGNKIGRITTAGSFSEFAVPTAASAPFEITAGPDGALWFTENEGNKIGRITTAGSFSEFPVPTLGSQPQLITAGPDGALWFTERVGNKIGRITTAGSFSEFSVPTAASFPIEITAGPDGALWFTEQFGNKIGRITPAGIISEFAVPTAFSRPFGITAGPDAALWFTEFLGNKIGRITTGAQATNLTFTAVSATTSDFDDPAKVAATLTDSSGQPISGKTVKFTLTPGGPSGTPTCSGVTDAMGTARCTLTPDQKAGSYKLTAELAGDASFAASKTSAPFKVTLEETTLNYTGPVLFANGTPAKLSGTLREDGLTPIFKQPGGAGSPRMVTFTLGSGGSAQSCSGTTDTTGTAMCSLTVNQPLGPTTVRAAFASDGFYQAATDSKPALVFAFVGGGLGNATSFVIGDKNAVVGGSVTFWGAQWAKVNALSGGLAPPAFKGFADRTSTTPPTCGGSWTTHPGDSSNPPGRVPAFMAVIASSSIGKSGATISGNAPHIVIVKTNPGYAPNPGHPGTGIVLAVLC
jgi:virginiamycin B lyase